MSSSSSINTGETPYWHWVLMGFVGLLRFVNLGFLDLQAWDEALYTVRAQSIVLFNEWIDQSATAIDGLYSSLHPPLHVWMTALSIHLFGNNEFAARFVSAAAGAITLPIIASIGKRMSDPQTGLIAALLFGLNPFVNFYARQGQFDALLVLCLTASAWAYIRFLQEPKVRNAILAGTFLGAALLSKLFVALGFPLAVVAFLFLRRRPVDPEILKYYWLTLGVAAALALPWHVFMSVRHADGNLLFFFSQSSLVERALFGIEGNVKPLEFFYYVNQLVVLFPIGIVWFLYGFRQYWGSRSIPDGVLFFWFLVFFTVFSIIRTKLAVYMLPLFVPLSLLAARGLWSEVQGTCYKNRWFVSLSVTVTAVLWASSQEARTAMKGLFASLVSLTWPDHVSLIHLAVWIIGLSALIGGAFLLTRWTLFPAFRIHIASLLLVFLGGQVLYDIVMADQTRFLDGGADLARFVDDNNVHEIVVAGYERNPQLTYYLRGADIGWRDDLVVRRIIPPKDSLAWPLWLADELGGEPSTALLIVEKDKFIRYSVVDPQRFVPEDMRIVFQSRRYSAYVRAPSGYYAVGTD